MTYEITVKNSGGMVVYSDIISHCLNENDAFKKWLEDNYICSGDTIIIEEVK